MDYKVVLTSRAESDLLEIVLFIAEKYPLAAERIGYALLETAESLAWLPYRGPAMKGRPRLRKLPHLPYHVIIYRVNEPARLVEIVRIWDGRQNPDMLHLP